MRKKFDANQCPTCDKVECAGCENGRCAILSDNNFNKDCPFFKTEEQAKAERAYCEERMAMKEREV